MKTIEQKKNDFFTQTGIKSDKKSFIKGKHFQDLKNEFSENLQQLESLARKGIDAASKAKECASLVFPTKRQLEKFAKEIPASTEWEKTIYPIQYSKLIYTQLLSSVKMFQKFF